MVSQRLTKLLLHPSSTLLFLEPCVHPSLSLSPPLSPQKPHVQWSKKNNLCICFLPLPLLCWFLSFSFSSCILLQTRPCMSSLPPLPDLFRFHVVRLRLFCLWCVSVVCVCVWIACVSVCLWPPQRPDQLHRHVSDAKTHVSAARPREEVSRPGRL